MLCCRAKTGIGNNFLENTTPSFTTIRKRLPCLDVCIRARQSIAFRHQVDRHGANPKSLRDFNAQSLGDSLLQGTELASVSLTGARGNTVRMVGMVSVINIELPGVALCRTDIAVETERRQARQR
jgi:hypothetical protein